MASYITGANVRGSVEFPGRLAVETCIDRHYRCIKVNQVILFAAVRVVASIAGAKTVESVQVFNALPETRGRNRVAAGGIRTILVAFKA